MCLECLYEVTSVGRSNRVAGGAYQDVGHAATSHYQQPTCVLRWPLVVIPWATLMLQSARVGVAACVAIAGGGPHVDVGRQTPAAEVEVALLALHQRVETSGTSCDTCACDCAVLSATCRAYCHMGRRARHALLVSLAAVLLGRIPGSASGQPMLVPFGTGIASRCSDWAAACSRLRCRRWHLLLWQHPGLPWPGVRSCSRALHAPAGTALHAQWLEAEPVRDAAHWTVAPRCCRSLDTVQCMQVSPHSTVWRQVGHHACTGVSAACERW